MSLRKTSLTHSKHTKLAHSSRSLAVASETLTSKQPRGRRLHRPTCEARSCRTCRDRDWLLAPLCPLCCGGWRGRCSRRRRRLSHTPHTSSTTNATNLAVRTRARSQHLLFPSSLFLLLRLSATRCRCRHRTRPQSRTRFPARSHATLPPVIALAPILTQRPSRKISAAQTSNSYSCSLQSTCRLLDHARLERSAAPRSSIGCRRVRARIIFSFFFTLSFSLANHPVVQPAPTLTLFQIHNK